MRTMEEKDHSNTWAVVGTGQSLTQDDVDYLRGKCRVIVISNAYKMAPWADILVSHDQLWWHKNGGAIGFAGKKYCRSHVPKVELFNPPGFPRGCNSGLMGLLVAKKHGAKKILLLGFDMHGTHYFGRHPKGLKNTTPERFKVHIQQFSSFSGCEVINCTAKSALKRYPMANLRDVL